jgi:hypothetical protein
VLYIDYIKGGIWGAWDEPPRMGEGICLSEGGLIIVCPSVDRLITRLVRDFPRTKIILSEAAKTVLLMCEDYSEVPELSTRLD